MTSVFTPEIEAYIRNLAPQRPAFMMEMEQYAVDNIFGAHAACLQNP